MPSDPISLYRHPLYFTLKEHHCFHPVVPIGPGTDCIGGEDVLNAWLPQGLKIQQYEVSLCPKALHTYSMPTLERNRGFRSCSTKKRALWDISPRGLGGNESTVAEWERLDLRLLTEIAGSDLQLVPGTSRKLGNGYNYTNSFTLSKNESLNDILVTGKVGTTLVVISRKFKVLLTLGPFCRLQKKMVQPGVTTSSLGELDSGTV